MSKKLLSVCSLLVVTGLVGTALGAAKKWTNANPVYDWWCESGNWSPSGVPGSSDTAIIDATSPDRGPVVGVGCNVDVATITGPDPNFGRTQVMDVNTSGTVEVTGDWIWEEGAGTAIININGSPTIDIGGEWRGADNGVSIVNIDGDPCITVETEFRGADESGSFYVNMGGGRLEIGGRLLIGDNGGGEINLSGGTIICNGNFDLGGSRGSAPITVNMTGGLIKVGQEFFCPANASRAGAVRVNVHGGVLDCNEFLHGGSDDDNPSYTDEWLVDIEEGTLKIKGDLVDAIDANVAAEQIIAYDGEGTVKVELIDGNTVVTAIPPDPNYASRPHPRTASKHVELDVVLHWTPGVHAASHDVYFGTDFDDVNNATTSTLNIYKGNQPVDQNSYDPNGPDPLKLTTTYYWRIDEVNSPHPDSPWKGKVRSFTTRREIIDPNLRVWYTFDEPNGFLVYDYSGYGHDGGLDGPEALWDPNDGHPHDGGSRIFDEDGDQETVVDVPIGVLEDIAGEVTVAVWLKDADADVNNYVCSTGAGGEAGPYQMLAVYPTADGDLMWRAGDDACDVLRWNLEIGGGGRINPGTLDGWHHWVFLKSESQDKMEIYFDGVLQASKDDVHDTLANVGGSAFKVGSATWQNQGFTGAMDDFRVYDIALSARRIAELFRGGDLGKAWAPQPFDRQRDVPRYTDLTWSPGDWVVTHDVYFGTDFDDVNDADTSTAEIYKGPKGLGDESYQPGPLTLKETYYWRIDEVNTADVNSPWTGNVWTFTVANFLVVDDMENYDDDASMPENPINGTWIDGWWNNTGSTVYLEYGSGAILQGGAKSMWLEYDNNYGYPVENYSEIHANTATGDKNLGFGRDWTVLGMKALSLFFYGASDNAIEPLYVVLEDTSGANSVSNYGDQGQELSDITVAEWRQWDMDLQDFNDGGVSIKDVNKIYIGLGDRDNPVAGGTGVLYIDDIRLYLRRCVPSLAKPAADFSNNCIVDLADVGIMAGQWLRTDANLSVSPPRDPPVGWWKLDGDATDSSTSGYHGTAEGTYAWVSGHIDQAIRFSGKGGKVLVADGGTTPLLRPADQISVTAWVRYSEPTGYSSRAVVKGVDAGDRENFALQVGEHAGDWFVRDVNTDSHSAGGSARLSPDEWNHVAGTFDGSAVSLYVNGQLEQSEDVNAMTLLQDSNSLAIGNAVDAYRTFMGKIDDVRVYNYGLSAEEVAYIATESTGGAGTAYMPLLSVAELYDTESEGQRAVNFRDYAVMMDAWLEEVLWP